MGRSSSLASWLRFSVVRVVVIALTGVVGALAVGCRFGDQVAAASPSPRLPVSTPIILVTVDTLRADRLPIYGYGGVETPAFDALRRDAVLFRSAWSHVPLTLPAHASLLSGRLPFEHGVRDNTGYQPAADVALLPEVLRRHGYATGAAVSSFVLRADAGLARGFDHYDDEVPRDADALSFDALQRPGPQTVERALAWLGAPRTAPPFLFLHLYEPHTPHDPPEPFRSRYGATYDGDVAAADAALGGFLDGLRRLDLYDRALVIVTSDHGEGLGDHGEEEHGVLLYREALEVPLLVKLPDGERGGTAVEAPAQLVDVPATILALLGLPPTELGPTALVARGTSLFALDPATPREIYAETLFPRLQLGWSDLHALIADGHQLIDGPDPELYDLATDPAQRTNLRAAERRRFADLRRRLAAYPRDFAAPASTDPETARKLQALGYLGGGAASPAGAGGSAAGSAVEGDLADPKARIGVLADLKAALVAAGRGEHQTAASALRAILEREPRLEMAWRQLARTLQQAGDLEGALAAHQRHLELFGAPPATLLAVGELYLLLGRLDEAERHAAAALDDDRAGALTLRARIAHRRGDLAAVLALTEQAIAALPSAAGRPGDDRRDAGAGDTWRPTPPRSVGAVPSEPDPVAPTTRGLYFVRGDALARLDRRDEAAAAFRREIARFPKESGSYASLAVLQTMAGDRAAARATLDALLAADPSPVAVTVVVQTLRILGDGARADEVLARTGGRSAG